MSTCIRCKQIKNLSEFWICKKEIYSYCKPCSNDYIIEKFGSFKNQYEYLKNRQTFINCECGKTITKPYWYKNHILSIYHKKHTASA